MRQQTGDYDSESDSDSGCRHRPKRQRSDHMTEFKPSKHSGKIGVHPSEWRKLPDDFKTYIQEYNSKIKHGEDPKEIQVPHGMNIARRVRRIRRTIPKEQRKVEQSEEVTGTRKNKNITFPLESETESGTENK